MRGPRSLSSSRQPAGFGLVLLLVLLLVGLLGGLAPAARATDSLPVRAFRLADGGRPLEAHAALLDGLATALASDGLAAPAEAAELEVAVRLLEHVTHELTAWPETLAALDALRPWPASIPPSVEVALQRCTARGLRATGRADQASGVSVDLGLMTNVWLAGPFDNESGSGFEVAYAPEQVFDRERPMDGRYGSVRWRPNPLDVDPLALIDLGASLRPATQSVAYVATAIRPLEAGPAVLRLGTSCSFKVFLDGHELASRRVERALALDQDRVVLPLHDGWNQLLVKLAVEDGPFQATLRVTDLAGRPLRADIDRAYTSWPEPPPDELLFYEEFDDGWSPMEDESFDWSSVGELLAQQGVELPPEFAELEGPELLEALMQVPEIAKMAERFMSGDGGDGGPGGPAAPSAPWPRGPLPTHERMQPADEAPQTLARLAAAGDPAAARLAALWELLVHPGDADARPLRDAAERALALEPDHVVALRLRALGVTPRGELASERETNPWRLALLDVLAADPDHVGALLDLARLHLTEAPSPSVADARLEQALAVAPDAWAVLTLAAERLDARDQPGAAEALRRRALASAEGALRVPALLESAGRAVMRGDVEAATALRWEAFGRQQSRRRVALELFDPLLDAGQLRQALFVIDRALAASPGDVELMGHAAGRLEHLEGDALHFARDLMERALDVCPDDAASRALAAEVAERLGLRGEAVGHLEHLLRVDPSDERARTRLAVLTGSAAEEPFWVAWEFDVAEALARPRLARPGAPLEALDRLVVWQVHADGTEQVYEHVLWRVLSDAGSARLADEVLRAAGGGPVTVTNLDVHRTTGVVEPVTPPRGRPSGAVALQLPPLSVGDVVDVAWRVDRRAPDVFGDIFGIRHRFPPYRGEPVDCARSELVVLVEPGAPMQVGIARPDLVTAYTPREVDGRIAYRWVAEELTVPDFETGMPPLDEQIATVDVTNLTDWDAFARWWWHVIEREFVTSPEMEQVVAELTRDAPDLDASIAAIVRFVSRDVRYNAWPFGTHGYEPYSAATILERRFGDCKDKAILLRQMLGLIGVDCHPVLLKASRVRAEEPLAVPFVGHFDHCIAWLPAQQLYVDPTAPDNPLGYLRADDQGARALHVTPDGGELRTIPYAPAAQNALVRRWSLALDADGAARVELLDTSRGDFAVRLRRRLGGERDLERALGKLESERLGAVEVLEARFEPEVDDGLAVLLEARLEADSVGSRLGADLALPLGLDPLRLENLAAEDPAERRHDVVLERPWSVDTVLRYALPAGWSPRALPEPARVSVPGVLSYALDVRLDDDGATLVVERSLEVTARRLHRARYAELHEALASIAEVETRPVVVGAQQR